MALGRSKMGSNATRAGILFLLSCSRTLAFRTLAVRTPDLVSDDVLIANRTSSAAIGASSAVNGASSGRRRHDMFIANGSSKAAMNHTTDVANMFSGAAMVQEEATAKTAVAEGAAAKKAGSERGAAQKAELDKTVMQSAAAEKTVAETAVAQQSTNRLTTLHLTATTAVATDGVIEKVFHGVGHRVSGLSSAFVLRLASTEVENINWYIVLAYVVLCCIVYGALVWARPAALDGKLDEKKKVENDLEHEFEDLVGDLELNLKRMNDLELGFIEHDFEDLRRDFCKFVLLLEDCDEEILNSLRTFILLWVGSYHDSTVGKAHSNAPPIVSELDLAGCCSVAEVCHLVSTNLGNRTRRKSTLCPQISIQIPPPQIEEEVRVAGLLGCSWLQIAGMNPGFYCAEGEPDQDGYPHTARMGFPGRMMEVTFFSPKHQSLWVAFLLGFVLAAVEIVLGHVVYPAMILVAQLLLLIVLVRFEHDDAETQCVLNINALVKKHGKVDKHRSEVREAVANAAKVKSLWMYRSVPYLRLIKAIHDKLEDARYGAERGYVRCKTGEKTNWYMGLRSDMGLQQINAGLAVLDANLGDKTDWYSGSDMIKTRSSSEWQVQGEEEDQDEEAFKLLGARINEAIRFVFEQPLSETIAFCASVFDVFSNVEVRVVACHDLPKYQSLLDKTDPYVRVRVGGASCSWKKTATVFNEPNPKWNTENVFQYAPGQKDVAIEVEVMEDHHVRVDKMIGLVHVPFRELSCGEWHHMVLNLDNAKQGKVEIAVKPTSDLDSYRTTLEERQVSQAAADEYTFGDLTKGLCSAGREARGDEATAKYKFGDLTRGVLTKTIGSIKPTNFGSKKNLTAKAGTESTSSWPAKAGTESTSSWPVR